VLTTLLILAGLVLLIVGHEAGHFFAAKAMKMKVEEFGFGFPPRIFAWRPKGTLRQAQGEALRQAKSETEYSLNWLPFGGFVRIAGESERLLDDGEKLEALPPEEKKRLFMFQAPWRRSVVILAGAAANFLLGWLLLSGVFMAGTAPTLDVYQVQAGSPAEAAGIRAGDVIQNFKTAEEFISYTGDNRGREVAIEVRRGGETLTFKVVPRVSTAPGEGPVGIVFAGIVGREPPAALKDGLYAAGHIARLTLSAFYEMLKGIITTGRVPEGIVGPVGIFAVAAESAKAGVLNFLQLLAFISVNLAVLNLIPFPALDGGRFVFILAEKLRGSPVPRKIEAWVNGVGFAFLILLMLVVTFRDVVKL
jgi:regulator of sigma E protease